MAWARPSARIRSRSPRSATSSEVPAKGREAHMTGFWVKVQEIGPDIGQLRHKLDSGAPQNFVLPVRRWVNISEDRVLAMFGMAVKGDDAGGSDQAYAALKARKKKKPEDVEKLLALVADIVAKAKTY